MRSLAFLVVSVVVTVAGASQAHGDEEKKLELERARVRKKIEDAVSKQKGPFVVVALVKTTYHTTAVRTSSGLVVRGGKVMQRDNFEFSVAAPGRFLPVEKVEWRLEEGREEAIEAIAAHVLEYVRVPKKGGPAAKLKPGETPPPAGSFRVIGQYRDAEKARTALERARAAYEAQPRWEAGGK